MKKPHTAWRVILFIFSILPLFYCQTTPLLAADHKKIVLIKDTADGKEISIPSIGIKKALLYDNRGGIIIVEVDKQGPLRWMMRDTRIMSVTWRAQTIRLDDEWNISVLALIKEGQEIFVHFLPPGELDRNKIETRGVDIRFGVYMIPDYTDPSSK
ncbi:MAG: hypothetical protein HZC03_01100 [Candidatus Lloydbacteria bacterium]|nr:hypothetical protein [Candidatus Lloydbacteria bacterium]